MSKVLSKCEITLPCIFKLENSSPPGSFAKQSPKVQDFPMTEQTGNPALSTRVWPAVQPRVSIGQFTFRRGAGDFSLMALPIHSRGQHHVYQLPCSGSDRCHVPEKPEVTRVSAVSLGDIPTSSACLTDTRHQGQDGGTRIGG